MKAVPTAKRKISRRALIPPNPLVGQYFHSLARDTGKVEWQGMIIGNPEPGWYLLQLFEWMMGEPNVRRLAQIDDMEHWLFYSDAAAMRFSYEHGAARPGSHYHERQA